MRQSRCVASAWRTKLLPMNPAPPVTSTWVMTSFPCQYRVPVAVPPVPPKAPKRFENVPMPASVTVMLNRLSFVTGAVVSPWKLKDWYSTANPQHCEL